MALAGAEDHLRVMYQLKVYYPGDRKVRETCELGSAAEVLAEIPLLLGRHEACERVVVMMGATRLFAVDCKGNRLEP